jgi:RNA polymerase sigma factor (sigma-70 family)
VRSSGETKNEADGADAKSHLPSKSKECLVASGRDFYAQCSEAGLVVLARKGDREAFAQIVRLHQSWIRNLMRRCCRDGALADDLAQDVFLRAWRTIHQLRSAERFGGWLRRLAVNVWLQHATKNDPLRNADAWDASEEAAPAQQDEAVSTALDLGRALATLPGHVRLCLVLSYHERMTNDEIADHTGIPMGTIKSHIRRGAQRMRALLSAYGPALADGSKS